jgi:hypothetical protein
VIAALVWNWGAGVRPVAQHALAHRRSCSRVTGRGGDARQHGAGLEVARRLGVRAAPRHRARDQRLLRRSPPGERSTAHAPVGVGAPRLPGRRLVPGPRRRPGRIARPAPLRARPGESEFGVVEAWQLEPRDLPPMERRRSASRRCAARPASCLTMRSCAVPATSSSPRAPGPHSSSIRGTRPTRTRARDERRGGGHRRAHVRGGARRRAGAEGAPRQRGRAHDRRRARRLPPRRARG